MIYERKRIFKDNRKTKIKDSGIKVGIFIFIDGVMFYDYKEADIFDAINNVDDGGRLFHKDLLKEALTSNLITKESKDLIKRYNCDNWEGFPRGRVYVLFDKSLSNIPTDIYISAARCILQNEKAISLIKEKFNIPSSRNIQLHKILDPEYDVDVDKKDVTGIL